MWRKKEEIEEAGRKKRSSLIWVAAPEVEEEETGLPRQIAYLLS